MSAPTDDRPTTPAALVDRLRRTVVAAGTSGVWTGFLLVFVVAWVVVATAGGSFLTVSNITSMLVRSVSLGLVAVGQTLVILAGSLDLSVAFLISVSAVLSSYLMAGDPGNIPMALGVVFGVGAVVGLINGLIITKFHVHPFITTLGTGLIMRGLLSSRFSTFTGNVPREFQQLGYGSIGPIPYSVLLLALVVAGAWIMLRQTQFGAHLYAVGGSEETARLSGVRSDRVKIGAHILCSLTAVLTGLFIAARLGSGAPWVGPDGGYDLESIAAVVVGGTQLSGGVGGVSGTVAGVFILAILDNVFNQLQVNAFLKQVLRGVIIIAAVAAYTIRSKREAE